VVWEGWRREASPYPDLTSTPAVREASIVPFDMVGFRLVDHDGREVLGSQEGSRPPEGCGYLPCRYLQCQSRSRPPISCAKRPASSGAAHSDSAAKGLLVRSNRTREDFIAHLPSLAKVGRRAAFSSSRGADWPGRPFVRNEAWLVSLCCHRLLGSCQTSCLKDFPPWRAKGNTTQKPSSWTRRSTRSAPRAIRRRRSTTSAIRRA
jgi:hypothetical protein